MVVQPPPPPERSSLPPEDIEAYDRATARLGKYATGRPLGPPLYSTLLHNPRIADQIGKLSLTYRLLGDEPGGYSQADLQWCTMVLGRELRFNMMAHSRQAIEMGVRPEAMLALYDDREDDLAPVERLLATHVRQVTRGTVTEESYRLIEAQLGVRGAVAYTCWIAHLGMIIRLQQVFNQGQGLPDDEIRAVAASVVDEAHSP